MELTQAVVEPLRMASLTEDLRGWWDDYYTATADVSPACLLAPAPASLPYWPAPDGWLVLPLLPLQILHLRGETHLGRKPGQMYSTTAAARDAYARTVLQSFFPPAPLQALADRLAARMRDRAGGRQWLGAHVRRGDFVQTGWVMETTAEAHIKRVKERLGWGRACVPRRTCLPPFPELTKISRASDSTLEELHADLSFAPYGISLPGAQDDGPLDPPPQEGDPCVSVPLIAR